MAFRLFRRVTSLFLLEDFSESSFFAFVLLLVDPEVLALLILPPKLLSDISNSFLVELMGVLTLSSYYR